MRVISGKYKNRELLSPRDPNTHPMGSREKLALFNMISPYLPSARVLDAFAGTGALGIEALSRGASEAVFVDNNAKAIRILRENLRQLSPEALFAAQVIHSSIAQFATTHPDQFDVIIADPPYNHIDINDLAALIPLLKPNGIFLLSHPADFPIASLASLSLISTHHYAAANLSLFTSSHNS